MEIQIPSHLILASLFIFSIFILSKLKTRSSNLPPGPTKLPLIGNLLNLIGPVPHRALRNLALKHGPLMHLQLGQLSAVIISSSDGAQQIMKTHDMNFATRPSILVSEIISYDSTSITFGPYGDYWRQLKKISTVELLSMKRVKSFQSIRERVYAELMTWIASREGSPVNLSEKLYTSTHDVTSMAALGMKTKEREKILEIIKQVAEAASGFDISDLYPSIKLLQMVSGLRRKLMRLRDEADVIFDDIIHDHRVAKSSDDDDDVSVKHRDLLDVILKLQDDGLEIPLTNENIKSILVDILGAGSETSATAMDWAMAEMLKNPRVLQKAQEEVRRVFDDKGYVDESPLIHELKYLKSVIKETLRTHPPLPLLLPRKCRQTCQINGYDIPTDTKIIINAWAISRDPKRWKNAESFEPERFLDDVVDFRGNHFEYIPFGAGRRICPGINFALASVELPLAMFLYHFDWNLPAGEELDMAEGFGATARRVKQLFVVPVVKRPLSKLVI